MKLSEDEQRRLARGQALKAMVATDGWSLFLGRLKAVRQESPTKARPADTAPSYSELVLMADGRKRLAEQLELEVAASIAVAAYLERKAEADEDGQDGDEPPEPDYYD